MRRAIFLMLAALAGCGGAGGDRDAAPVAETPGDLRANVASPNPSGSFASSGQTYADLAAAGDAYEIAASRVAAHKSANADVRALAQMLVADHQRSTAQLTAAAAQARPQIRVAPAMKPGQLANLAVLGRASEAAFDLVYLRQQQQAHQEALALVQGFAQSGDSPPMRQHAAQSTAVVRQHLQRIEALLHALGG